MLQQLPPPYEIEEDDYYEKQLPSYTDNTPTNTPVLPIYPGHDLEAISLYPSTKLQRQWPSSAPFWFAAISLLLLLAILGAYAYVVMSLS